MKLAVAEKGACRSASSSLFLGFPGANRRIVMHQEIPIPPSGLVRSPGLIPVSYSVFAPALAAAPSMYGSYQPSLLFHLTPSYQSTLLLLLQSLQRG